MQENNSNKQSKDIQEKLNPKSPKLEEKINKHESNFQPGFGEENNINHINNDSARCSITDNNKHTEDNYTCDNKMEVEESLPTTLQTRANKL